MPQHIITDKAFHAIAHGPDRHAQTHGRRKVSLQFTRPGKNPFQIKKIFFFIFAEKREFQLQSGIATISGANNPSIIRSGNRYFVISRHFSGRYNLTRKNLYLPRVNPYKPFAYL